MTTSIGAGVIIGRFQVSDLTRGHDELLHRVARNHDKVVVLLGVHPKLSTKENPLGFESREKMLQTHWADTIGKNTDKTLIVAPLPNRATDPIWSKQVDVLLDTLLGPLVSKTLYGGRDSFVKRYTGRFPIGDIRTEIEKDSEHEFKLEGSGTEQRRILFDRPPITEAGRAGAIWAVGNQWNRIDPCVDIAVVSEGRVVMGVKYGGSGLLCFPGGHIDSQDKTAEHAASRELLEETGLEIPFNAFEYVCQVPIEDWRNVPSQVTWSTLYTVEYTITPGVLKAGDDLDDVFLIDLKADLATVSPSHHELFKKLQQYYGISL